MAGFVNGATHHFAALPLTKPASSDRFQATIQSFLATSVTKKLDHYNDSYYLDRYETTEYYCPAFLQDRYREDLNYLKEKAERTLVRVQQFQVMEIQEIYTRWYNAIVFRLLEGMAEMAIEEIMESGIRITDRFQILYGDYMGKTVILYEKGREE